MTHEFARLEDSELPFYSMQISNVKGTVQELIRVEGLSHLKILNLTPNSTAEDTRRVAISLRRKMEESGLDVTTVKALKWALDETRDCIDEREFLWFLLDNQPFDG